MCFFRPEMVANRENGTLVIDTVPWLAWYGTVLAVVACPAPSDKNTPLPCLATLFSFLSQILLGEGAGQAAKVM